MPQIRSDIPNLELGEVAFQLDSGELVTLRFLQRPSPDGHHIPLVLDGRLIDDKGAAVLKTTPFHPEPHPVRLPASVHSVQDGALDHTTLSEIMARETAAALTRWPMYLLGLAALSLIPAAPAKGAK